MSQSVRRALFKAKGLPDPGPTPSIENVLISVLVSKAMAKGIDELAGMLVSHFPTRQDLLVALLEDGLRSAAQAAAEAEAQRLEQSKPQPAEVEVAAHPEAGSLIHVKPGITAAEAMAMSERLQALKRGDTAPAYGVRAAAPEPSDG